MTVALVALALLTVVADDTRNIPAINTAATATAPAVRQPSVAVDNPPVPQYAPEGLDDCTEMQWYRQQAGLPAVFDAIGYRESRCTNTPISRTGCCVGYLQLHWIIFRDHRTRPLIDTNCASATWWDVRGDTPQAKAAQMCVARQLYTVDGLAPWN